MSKQFKIVLFIRSLGYAIFLCGLIAVAVIFGPLIQAELNYRKDKFFKVKREVPPVIATTSTTNNSETPTLTFGNIESKSEALIPTSTKFGIVIPKINANADVVANVDPGNEKEYIKALQKGVAHAQGTTFPGEKGNIYLFSHSTDSPWNVARFNAVFYLLRELEPGDDIVIFYNDQRYDYEVYDKQIVPPTDIHFLTSIYDQSVLTLQTCDPPGTSLNRLIVRAKLKGGFGDIH
jgi:LPXTG-site transpeptidase (sortase) family protein